MKILFICENYIPHYGGAEVVFKNLAEGLVNLGHKVAIITQKLKDTESFENINGVKVHRINSFSSRYLFTFLSIFKSLKLAKYADIIQTTTFNGAPPAWLTAKICGKPVCITVHETWINKWSKVTNLSRFNCLLHEFLERMIFLLPFNKYICVSNATKNDLIKFVNKKKVTTIHNGLDYTLWNPRKFKKINLGLNDKFVYLSWGRPGMSKGFEYLIKSIPHILNKVSNAHFLLMLGSIDTHKEQFKKLKNLINKLNINEHITILPSAPYNKLGHYIKSVNCIIIPSIAEGFGYTTVESNAMRQNVIVSDAGSLPEVVSGNHLIFKNKNVYDLANKAILAAEGKFNKKVLKRFLWIDSIEKYLKIYEWLIKK